MLAEVCEVRRAHFGRLSLTDTDGAVMGCSTGCQLPDALVAVVFRRA